MLFLTSRELGQGQRLPVYVRHVLRYRYQPGGQRGCGGVHPVEDHAKRPLCNEAYYETFNRDNVTLVSIEEKPIEAIMSAPPRPAST